MRHPERVSHLILYGGYALGWAHRDDTEGLRRYRAITELARLGWGKDNPVFRQLFTGLFIPGGTPEQFGWFNELCRRTTTPEVAMQLLKAAWRRSTCAACCGGLGADPRDSCPA